MATHDRALEKEYPAGILVTVLSEDQNRLCIHRGRDAVPYRHSLRRNIAVDGGNRNDLPGLKKLGQYRVQGNGLFRYPSIPNGPNQVRITSQHAENGVQRGTQIP
jgi:hypothetical protein